MRKKWLSALKCALVSRTLSRQVVRHLYQVKWDAQSLMLPVPPLRAVSLEVTNHCNLDCIMCANKWMKRPRGFMTQEIFDLVREQIPDGSLNTVSMFAVGEPLLHRNLPSFCSGIKAKPDCIFLSTNAVALEGDRNLAGELMRSGIGHFHVSADGYDADSYEKVRKGTRFNDFLYNLRILKEARDINNPGLDIELQFCLTSQHSLSQIARALSIYGPHVDLLEFKPLNNQAHQGIHYSPRQRVVDVSCYFARPHPCRMLWGSCTILWDGRVSACCRDYDGALIAGDVRKQPLDSIWRNTAYRTLRRDHLRRRFPQCCKNCSELFADATAALALNHRIRKLLAAGRLGRGQPARLGTDRVEPELSGVRAEKPVASSAASGVGGCYLCPP